MGFKSRFVASVALSLAATTACYYANESLSIARYTIKKGLERPLKILQISDLHDKEFGKQNHRLLSAVDRLAPHCIVLTGDTISTGARHLERTSAFVRTLCTIAPVFAVLGNHEQRRGMGHIISYVLAESGATVLTNELWSGSIKGIPVHILGLCEQQAIDRGDYIKAALGRLEYEDHSTDVLRLSQCDGVRILLSHFPENYSRIGSRSYNRFPFEVMFAGHAHGGQMRLPVLGGLFAPGQGVLPMFSGGIYRSRHRDNTLVVSCGLGNDGPLPRINNRPQLVLTTIV